MGYTDDLAAKYAGTGTGYTANLAAKFSSEVPTSPAPAQAIPVSNAPGMNLGPAGIASGFIDNGAKSQADSMSRSAILAMKGGLDSLPLGHGLSSKLPDVTPQGLGEELIYGSGVTAGTIPQVMLGEGLVTKAIPGLASTNLVPSMLRSGAAMGGVSAVKGTIEGTAEGGIGEGIKRGVEGGAKGFATGAMYTGLGRLGSKAGEAIATRAIPGVLSKGVPVGNGEVIKNVPTPKARMVHGAGVVGDAIASGAGAYISSSGNVADTLLGGALGLMGGNKAPEESFSRAPETSIAVRPKLGEGHAVDPVEAYIKQRTEQKFSQKKAEAKSSRAELALRSQLSTRKSSAVEPSSVEGFLRAKDLLMIADDLLAKGDIEGAQVSADHAKAIIHHEIKPNMQEEYAKLESALSKEGKDVKGKRVSSYEDMLLRMSEKAHVPDAVLKQEAKQETINEVVHKSLSFEIYIKGSAAAKELMERITTGQGEAASLMSLPDAQQISQMVMSAAPLKTTGGSKDMLGIMRELDNFQPNGPFQMAFYDNMLKVHNDAKQAHVKRMVQLRTDLQSAGFNIKEWTLFGSKYHKNILANMLGTYDTRQETILARLAENLPTDIPKGQEAMYDKGKRLVRSFFDEMYFGMRDFLKQNGKDGYEYITDYIPWIKETGFFDDILTLPTPSPDSPSVFAKAQMKAFNFLFRPKERPGKIIDLFSGMDMYARLAYESKIFDPMVKRLRLTASTARDIGRGDIAKYFDRLASDMTNSAARSTLDVWASTPVAKNVQKISDHFYSNILSTFKAALNQTISSALIIGAPEASGRRAGVALDVTKELIGAFYANTVRTQTNNGPQLFAEKMGSLTYKARKIADVHTMENQPGVMGSFFHGLTSTIDEAMVSAAFKTGYEYARRNNMSNESARALGDMLAGRTQAVYYKTMKPQILREAFGRFALPLSTSTFAAMNSIRDILDNTHLSAKQKAGNIGIIYAASVLLGIGRHMFSQEPDPVASILTDAMFGHLPIVGSWVRYGEVPLPGALGFIARYLGNPTKEKAVETLAVAGGPSGMYQLVRSARGLHAVLNEGIVTDKSGRVKYQFDPTNLIEILRSIVFGPSATQGASEEFTKSRPNYFTTLAKRITGLWGD